MTAAPPAPSAGPPTTATTRSRSRSSAFLLLRVALSALLLAWVLRRTALHEVLAAAAGADRPLLAVGYATHLLGIVLSASRWRVLLRAHGVDRPIPTLVRSVLVASFFNNFLPSTIGGDALRAYDSYRFGGRRASVATAVVVDRLLGLLALGALALGSVAFAPELRDRLPLLPLWVASGSLALAAATGLIFAGRALRLAFVPGGLRRPLLEALRAFAAYRGRRATLARALFLSLLLQANVVFYYLLIGESLGLPVPPVGYLVIVPLALFVTLLPVTINGIGLREGALAVLLAAYGVPSAEAVAYAWLVYLGSLLFSLVGGVLYAARR